MNKIFLGLGSNIGNKEKNLESAIKLLSKNIFNIKKSKIYKTKPFGITNQDNFLNMVIFGETEYSPEELLKFVKNIEKKVGRIHRFIWGPREIDIDILFFNDLVLDEPDLKIPHIGVSKRDFVLKPMMDIEKDFIHPVFKKGLNELYAEIDEKYYTIIP